MNFDDMQRKLNDASETASWHPAETDEPSALSLREQQFLLDIARNAYEITIASLPCDVQLLDDRTIIVRGLPIVALLRALGKRQKKVSP